MLTQVGTIRLTRQDVVVSVPLSVLRQSGGGTAEQFLVGQSQFLKLPGETCG